MSFQKNRIRASAGIVGSVSLVILMSGLLILWIHVDPPVPALTLYVVITVLASVFCVIYLVTIAIDEKSTVIVSEAGIEIKSKIKKTRSISWKECGFIGTYRYYYALLGILVFSTEKYTCYSPIDCRRFASKNRKSIISVAYTPELFAAVEKYAPAHLVSGCKALFPM